MKKDYFNKTVGALKTLFFILCGFTVISAQAQCTANYTYTPGANGTVFFKSTSLANVNNTTPTIIQWTFGDGSSGGGDTITHAYSYNGKKVICVTVNDSTCTDIKCDSIYITSIQTSTPSNCSHAVVYSMSKDSSQSLTWNAFASYPPNVSNATWLWGDGSSSTGLYPSHTYSAAGTYSTCVTVSVSCDSITGIYCYIGNIFKSSESNVMIRLKVIEAKMAGILNLEKDNDLLAIYPNPGNGFFTVELDAKANNSKQLNISIYNMLGEKVYEQNNIYASKQAIDISALSAGTYFVKVLSENGLYTKKILMQK